MAEICIHDNVKSCCSRCREVCWMIMDTTNEYYLKEFYTGETRKIPKRYCVQIDKLLKRKTRFNSGLCDCEVMLRNIIEKVLKGRKK